MAERNKMSFKDKVLDELIKNGQTELYDDIIENNLETDEDVKNFLAASKDYLLKTKGMPKSTIDAMPSFKSALYGTIGKSEVDLDKAFADYGPDWYKHLNDISYQEIQEVADKAGVDWKALNNRMAKEATAKMRADVANGADLGGWFESPASFGHHASALVQQFIAPRVNEAVARGEDPTLKDYALDFGEQALYAMPWARGAGMLARGLGTGKRLGTLSRVLNSKPSKLVLGNAVTPFISETADALAYDSENNPRGDFSVTDVIGNTAVNLGTMPLAKGTISSLSSVFGQEGLAKKVYNLGEGKSAKEITDELRKKYRIADITDADNPRVSAERRKKGEEMKSLSRTDPELFEALSARDPVIWRIAEQPGKNIDEKTINFIKSIGKKDKSIGKNDYVLIHGGGHTIQSPNLSDLYNQGSELKWELAPEFTEHYGPKSKFLHPKTKYVHSPVTPSLRRTYDKLDLGVTEGARNDWGFAKEEAAKNYISNHVGPALSEQRRGPWAIVPLVGPLAEEKLHGTKEEQERKAARDKRERVIQDLAKKYPGLKEILGKYKSTEEQQKGQLERIYDLK